ncbi:uncharacterized protein LOC124845310 [Vigna umbellata]|uniref:uncharacterized protein LOC124845310 n=1 Tax=Vigna umbellata TaxID=87088 RepID=UPI001F5FC410|nr:uncharacterized protein LOC124845310 [Vigna umbellata]
MAGFLTLFQSWIYEHFPSMGRRQLVSSYDDTTPRAARWQSPRQSSTLVEIRSQLDGLRYSGVEIPRPPTVVADADVVIVDYAWLHFMNHVIINVRHASYPSECVDGYIQWFRRVSHPYIIPAPLDARPALAPTQRPNVPQEARPHCRSSPPSPSGVVARFRRMARMLISLISCRHVIEGTVEHQVSVDLLQIARRIFSD